MLEVPSIFLSIALLMFFAYKGVSVLVLAPLLASCTVLLSGQESLLAHYTQIFMVKLGDFATIYFPLFLLSAIFGKIMENSGSARAISEYVSQKIGPEKAILATVLSCAVLTYGGVSLFVVAFAVYPIAVALFRKADIPKRLIPPAIALGSFTFTMVALPGTPAIQNAIPTQYFGTNTFAAPGLGIIAATLMFVGGMFWLRRQLKFARIIGEGYGQHDDRVLQTAINDLPNFWVAVMPVILVILVNYISVKYVFPNIDTSYLQTEKYGATDIKVVAGNWGIIVAVFFSILFLTCKHFKRINLLKCLNGGAADSLLPIFNTASVVGYGAVINSLPGFVMIRDQIISLSSENPIISGSCVTGALCAITGSASGGLSISMEMIGEQLLKLANQANVSPEVLHRIISLASSTLHALPHNGAIITLLVICGLTHKDSYRDILVVSLVNTTVATLIAILIYNLLGVF